MKINLKLDGKFFGLSSIMVCSLTSPLLININFVPFSAKQRACQRNQPIRFPLTNPRATSRSPHNATHRPQRPPRIHPAHQHGSYLVTLAGLTPNHPYQSITLHLPLPQNRPPNPSLQHPPVDPAPRTKIQNYQAKPLRSTPYHVDEQSTTAVRWPDV